MLTISSVFIYIPFALREKVAEGRMREESLDNQPVLIYLVFLF
jgi:hypothetical protein